MKLRAKWVWIIYKDSLEWFNSTNLAAATSRVLQWDEETQSRSGNWGKKNLI